MRHMVARTLATVVGDMELVCEYRVLGQWAPDEGIKDTLSNFLLGGKRGAWGVEVWRRLSHGSAGAFVHGSYFKHGNFSLYPGTAGLCQGDVSCCFTTAECSSCLSLYMVGCSASRAHFLSAAGFSPSRGSQGCRAKE